MSQSLSASLTLPKIISKILGFNTIQDILKTLKEHNIEEYEFTTENSNIIKFLIPYVEKNVEPPFNIVDETKLTEYDLNIKQHMETILSKRDISFKAYQYFALLFTEIYLDYYFKLKSSKDTKDFIDVFLNKALEKITKHSEIENYTEQDLDKLCYWMATGSGKTLIMHVNYLQYLHYADKYNLEINNVILITPNEDLSKQHEKQFNKSNLKSMQISKKNYKAKTTYIKIIDINKIREKAGPETVSYKAFGKNNLILVDEGHRGASGKTWMKYRSDIAKEGFTLEYSATFQDTKKGSDYLSDYKKTILYDYSYKYYHNDGYGKDYEISNTNQKDNDNYYENLIMLGNLLSFFEQKKLYQTYKKPLELDFNIEDPLWILVGSKVVEKSTDTLTKSIKSDILKFVRFLHELKTKRQYFLNEIKKIFENKTPLKYKNTNESFFENKYQYLKEEYNNNYDQLFQDIFKTVLYTSNNDAKLILEDIKGSDGEIGLRYTDSGAKYFGLIYVGKGNDKKIIKSAKDKNILTSEQSIKESLFQTLNKKDIEHPLNILIGAKKFIEGWDNYRISSMLLMNFAKSKGVSAIQLFGRGVRLHGYNNSMKRSNKLNPPIKNQTLKKYLPIIETLNVFGIQAKYMDSFREELEEDIEFYIEKEIYINKDPYNLIRNELKCIKEDEDTVLSFKENKLIKITQPIGIIKIDLDKHIQAISSIQQTKQTTTTTIPQQKIINQQFFNIVDWNYIIAEIRRYKRNNEYRNISIPSVDTIKDLLLNQLEITINGDEHSLIETFSNYEEYQQTKQTLQRIYLEILKKHIKTIYNKNFRKFYESKLKVTTFNKEKDLLDRYKIKIYLDKKGNIKGDTQTKKFLKIIQEQKENLINIYDLIDQFKKQLINTDKFIMELDKHLYIPILISSPKGEYTLNPKGLVHSEKRFINDVKKFIKKNDTEDQKIIILRNHEKTGLGYYLETEKYYPDFIMWIIQDDKQKIFFIDPKGLVHVDREKIDFHNKVKEIESKIKKDFSEENIELKAYIVTETKQDDIGDSKVKQDPSHHGVYFFDDNYIQDMLS